MSNEELTLKDGPTPEPAKVARPVLTALVVGSMVGAGVFTLPGRFAIATGVGGAVIAWVVSGVGMLMLALCFQSLAVRKPRLDAGVFIYAKAGFGDYIGFNSAIGFWASACAGNAFYWIFISSTIGAFAPAFGDGDTIVAVAVSTAGVWLFHSLIVRGIRDAAIINRIVTVCKILPIVMFIVVLLFAFDPAVFAANFRGSGLGSMTQQVKNTMVITAFVFLGIEGATVYSRYAEKREHVGQATVLGFLSVLCLFALVTLVSYGTMPREEIASVRQPSMAGVLESSVGTWGTVVISIGVIISVLGAYLAWTLMAAEVLFMPARSDDLPKMLGRENKAGTPIVALICSTVLVQILIALTLFVNEALDFMLDLTTTLSLFPYVLAAAYLLKLALTGESYHDQPRTQRKDSIIAGAATVYTLFLFIAAGLKFLLLAGIILAPATILFVKARSERAERIFTPSEVVVFAAVITTGVVGVIGLATGFISI